MKTIIELAREVWDTGTGTYNGPEWGLERFAQLVRDAYREELLAGVGEPVVWMDTDSRVMYDHDTSEVDKYHGFKPTAPLHTADQLAAAVLRATLAERERCAKVCEAEEDDSSNWRTESAVAHRIAAAIRAGETK